MDAATQEWSGERLRTERERGGVQQQELARALNRNRTFLSDIERGFLPIPDGFGEEYVATVRRIVRERAESFGLLPATEEASQ